MRVLIEKVARKESSSRAAAKIAGVTMGWKAINHFAKKARSNNNKSEYTAKASKGGRPLAISQNERVQIVHHLNNQRGAYDATKRKDFKKIVKRARLSSAEGRCRGTMPNLEVSTSTLRRVKNDLKVDDQIEAQTLAKGRSKQISSQLNLMSQLALTMTTMSLQEVEKMALEEWKLPVEDVTEQVQKLKDSGFITTCDGKPLLDSNIYTMDAVTTTLKSDRRVAIVKVPALVVIKSKLKPPTIRPNAGENGLEKVTLASDLEQ